VKREVLQWYGLFGAALAWAAQHVAGFGVATADCANASRHWGLDVTSWVIVFTAVGLLCAASAEAAAISILRETRTVEYDAAPPDGRRHFFAFAAALGNILFIGAIVLNAVGVLASNGCRPA
jgi:predicted LPLAT superfamily acyltransferase